MSKAERQSLRYTDYYCIMSLAEFMAWVQGDGDSEPHINYQTGTAG